jgi:excisionase family DNA binding protein
MTAILTLSEVAHLLRVHESTVYRMLRRHQLPAFKMGHYWRFSSESIERWMKESQYPARARKE